MHRDRLRYPKNRPSFILKAPGLKAIAALAALLMALSTGCGSSSSPKPPANRAPTLNTLAQQGIQFTQTWVQPYCSPTRASILTGLYAAKTGVLDYSNPLSRNHETVARILRDEAGYSTAIFGKWHVAGLGFYPNMKPKQAGFDLFLGNLDGAIDTYWSYDYHIQDETTPPNQWRTETAPTRSLPGIAPTTYAPVVKVADTIGWITARESAIRVIHVPLFLTSEHQIDYDVMHTNDFSP